MWKSDFTRECSFAANFFILFGENTKRHSNRKLIRSALHLHYRGIYEYVLDLFAHVSLRSRKNGHVLRTIFHPSLFAQIIFHSQCLFSLVVAPLGFSDYSPSLSSFVPSRSLFLCPPPIFYLGALFLFPFRAARPCSLLSPPRLHDLELAQIIVPIPYLRNTGQENASGKIRTNLEIVSVHKFVSAAQEKARHNTGRIYRMQMQYRYSQNESESVCCLNFINI